MQQFRLPRGVEDLNLDMNLDEIENAYDDLINRSFKGGYERATIHIIDWLSEFWSDFINVAEDGTIEFDGNRMVDAALAYLTEKIKEY